MNMQRNMQNCQRQYDNQSPPDDYEPDWETICRGCILAGSESKVCDECEGGDSWCDEDISKEDFEEFEESEYTFDEIMEINKNIGW